MKGTWHRSKPAGTLSIIVQPQAARYASRLPNRERHFACKFLVGPLSLSASRACGDGEGRTNQSCLSASSSVGAFPPSFMISNNPAPNRSKSTSRSSCTAGSPCPLPALHPFTDRKTRTRKKHAQSYKSAIWQEVRASEGRPPSRPRASSEVGVRPHSEHYARTVFVLFLLPSSIYPQTACTF